ncbi:MAG: hypothetical protein K2M31_09670 [Muribaculaceae bacterium]|nr:hypothetical protein [Muribaculaceae bacterium]
MLSNTIIRKIEEKFGKENIQSGDCAALAGSIGIGETTIKRMLGLVGDQSPERNRVPRLSTYDMLSQWLGYPNYKALLTELNEGDYSSEFIDIPTLETTDLDKGTQVQLRYEPSRILVMTYMGNDQFLINESKNSKLLKGDIITMSHFVLGMPMIVKNVMRGEKNMGGYIGAKDGGLTSLEVIV